MSIAIYFITCRIGIKLKEIIIVEGRSNRSNSSNNWIRRFDFRNRIIVLEKSSEVGGYLVSGAILQKDEYYNYITKYLLNYNTVISKECLQELTENSYYNLTMFLPDEYRNKGNILIDIVDLC